MSQADEPQKKRKSGGKLNNGLDPSIGKATQIKPGEVRNPGGRPKKTPITDLYADILDDPIVIKRIRASVEAMITGGRMAGQLQLKEMAERVEGKVTQPVKGELEVTLTLSERLLRAKERIDGQ